MTARSLLVTLWVVVICVLAGVHFVHLSADFPNYARWMDWSKYTDEGWYANAVIEHYLRGSWYVPGDFNVAAAVPVWPILEWIVFHFTGMGIVAARALVVSIFCINLLLAYFLIRKDWPAWVALFSLTLIATSSFVYCFGRLAILEPLLVGLTLVSLLLARRLGSISTTGTVYALSALLGALFCMMVLTKTTAVFLVPAILYMLWHSQRDKQRQLLISAGCFCMVAALLWAAYFLLLVRPHYLEDYHYFFKVNVYPRPQSLFGWLRMVFYAAHGIFWVDRTIVLVAMVLIFSTGVWARSVWRDPVFVSSLLVIGGYVVFITRICNMQPRYYVVIAYFLFLLVPIATAALLRKNRVLARALIALSVAAIAWSSWELGGFVLYPEYTFVNAAKGIASYIDQHPNGNRLLLSVSGNSISLITGVPSLCDDFGTMPLRQKLALYRPGWYAAWNDLDPDIVNKIEPRYKLVQAATFKAFDDDDRDTLVLYKLVPGTRAGGQP